MSTRRNRFENDASGMASFRPSNPGKASCEEAVEVAKIPPYEAVAFNEVKIEKSFECLGDLRLKSNGVL